MQFDFHLVNRFGKIKLIWPVTWNHNLITVKGCPYVTYYAITRNSVYSYVN